MQDSSSAAALPYQDPPIKTILILSSFLILLNAINHVLNRLIYCGLIGQVLIGVAFGTPGLKWLGTSTERVIVQLGYLGLILLVYEGGLNTNFKSLKANAGLSTLVALVGICLPIAFAFSLRSLASATPLQAFAVGAALCSTSLGTTFSILSSSGLTNTRLGTVLTSAAMMDDVVGLVLVQVISKLGSGSSAISAITVVRPVAVSIGLAISVLLACLYLVKPFPSWIAGPGSSTVTRAIREQPNEAALIVQTILLFGMVAAASYAGTSNLFAAYLAGASISWYYSEVVRLGSVVKNERTEVTQSVVTASVQRPTHNDVNITKTEDQDGPDDSTHGGTHGGTDRRTQLDKPAVAGPQAIQGSGAQLRETKHAKGSLRGASTYMRYVEQSVERVLKPFFFASIGFSIPLTRMFASAVVWRGIVFTILMLVGKLATGICLVRIAAPSGIMVAKMKVFLNHLVIPQWSCLNLAKPTESFNSRAGNTADGPESKATSDAGITLAASNGQTVEQSLSSASPPPPQEITSTTKSRSLYPAAIVGTAMMARGEIGFLIAALAESTGIFASHGERAISAGGGSEIYLVAIWAIVLCTIIGPVSVGLLVRRVKKLQQQRREHGGGEDPLGVWGVL